MYQHQNAPLPLDLLEAVPQPIVVLLEVLLAKDPGRHLRNPTDLLKAIATIASAIDAGRKMTHPLVTMCIGGGQGIAAIFEHLQETG